MIITKIRKQLSRDGILHTVYDRNANSVNTLIALRISAEDEVSIGINRLEGGYITSYTYLIPVGVNIEATSFNRFISPYSNTHSIFSNWENVYLHYVNYINRRNTNNTIIESDVNDNVILERAISSFSTRFNASDFFTVSDPPNLVEREGEQVSIQESEGPIPRNMSELRAVTRRFAPKKLSYSSSITLYETGEVAKKEDVVFIPALGYFKKDDPRVIKDYANPEIFLVLDSRYSGKVLKVYDDISMDGCLIHNNNYTFYKNPTQFIPFDTVEKVYNMLPNILLINGEFGCIDKKLIKHPVFKVYYKESLRDGIFYDINKLPQNGLKKEVRVKYRQYKTPTGFFLESIEGKPNTFINTLGKKYKFGVEIETISGYVPEYLDKELFTSAVHDGSLRDVDTGEVYGGEYVTDILQGDQGLAVLKKLCFQLTKRCLIDRKCGIHTHIGDVNFNKENIVLMYYLYQKLQKEIFSMLPISRRKNEYCRFLEPVEIFIENILSDRKYYIDLYYNNIISTLSKKDYTNKHVNKKKDHPKGFKCGYDHSSSRYCWVNFVPAVFNTRKNNIYTIEFRPMQASTSYVKIKNWLLICFGLVSVVENNKQLLYNNLDVTLNDVIKEVYGNKSLDILNYIEARKEKFSIASEKTEMEDYQDNELDDNFKIINV